MTNIIALINALTAAVTLSALKSVLLAMAGAMRPYKVYSGLISQSGTSAPTIVIQENSLGSTPTSSYIDYGVFGITLTGQFLENKTWYIIRPNTNTSSGDQAYMLRANDDTIRVYANDDTLDKVPFEIRIYP